MLQVMFCRPIAYRLQADSMSTAPLCAFSWHGKSGQAAFSAHKAAASPRPHVCLQHHMHVAQTLTQAHTQLHHTGKTGTSAMRASGRR